MRPKKVTFVVQIYCKQQKQTVETIFKKGIYSISATKHKYYECS